MTARIFVSVKSRDWKSAAPERRTVRESLRTHALEHAVWNADVGYPHGARMQPPRQQHVTRLAAEKGDALACLDGGAHHGAGRPIDAARQIDRNDRRSACIHRVNHSVRLALDHAVQPCAE